LQHHAALIDPVQVHLVVPGGALDVPFAVGEEGLHDHAGCQADEVGGVPTQIGDVVHGALYPVVVLVLHLRHAAADQQLFRAQRVGDALVLGAGADAVARIDGPLQLRAGDARVVLHVLDQLALEQVDVADELADQAAGRGLVDVHGAAHLGDPALVHDGDALGPGHGLFLVVGDGQAGRAGGP